ncbi:MucR family transcriptional regulator [Methylobacterium isbiliense]|uniref:Transcriptional regulatory protein ros n=1 Tax=Methylobacterium isbiliense TaxID=315478 RepID=A0ABQ4SKZ6_9HYPH|nr:MucR family transcriptional regulator [Methylobacterium isbiliense]MDN3626179.1 MucR family transcriptional regulator [Methylobacterium isbiliense]GJE02971.1 hypothetical protein GMJLKIPL_4921 [Methylobacterium isbiliense]
MDQAAAVATPDMIELTAQIVSAYVMKNAVPVTQIPDLIAQVHGALRKSAEPPAEFAPERLQPALAVKKSITPDFLVCLEDGKRFKSMRRHLSKSHGMTPDHYRAKWGLAPDYPMVAPNYAAARSKLARSIGLGQKTKEDLNAKAVAAEKARTPRKRASKSSDRAQGSAVR